MANKREFKKFVSGVSGAVCNDMMVAYYNIDGIDREAVDRAVAKVLKATGFARCNSNIFFDKGPGSFAEPKEYSRAKRSFFRKLFEKLRGDYLKALDEALKEFNAAVPEAVKESNKAAAE